MKELEKYRKQIDEIDAKILSALNKRAEYVLRIGDIKRTRQVKFYNPERERQVIERLQKLNPGPFPNDALKTLYREIFSASLSLEKPLKVAYFGPAGTYTHLAAMRHFGSSTDLIALENIKKVFEAVNIGDVDYGVVPIENSSEGVVSYTLDMFVDFDLKIVAEEMVRISHQLLSISGDKSKIKTILSHSQPIGQCRLWLEANMPGIAVKEAASTAKAAEIASQDESVAAIASDLAATIYGLAFIARNIEDSKNNFTRFLVISKDCHEKTGKDKTSIMFSVKDKPGALYDILTPFKKARINLTKIESRPSKKKAWDYIFFIDMEGHIDDRKLKKAIEEMKNSCFFLKILGSYPYGGR